MNNLLTAIMTKCAGTALSTAVGGRIFLDVAPEGSEYPYATIQIVASNPDDPFQQYIDYTVIQFSIYSTSMGAAEITTIYAALLALLDGQTLSVTGGTCLQLVRQGLTTMYDDVTTQAGTVGVRHWSIDYMITVKKT